MTVANLRETRGELEAKLQELRGAPRPREECKARIRAEIDRLTNDGQPNVASVVDHAEPIRWPRRALDIMVAGAPGAVVHGQGTDMLALLTWMFRDELLVRLDRMVDELVDDAIAVPTAERAGRERELLSQILQTERRESKLVWASGDLRQLRPEMDPRAVLLVAARSESDVG